MGACSSRKVADLIRSSQVHPLVEKLSDGLAIYSQSFLNDFWLVYKNTHIVVSCFTVHRAHYFTPSERFWVLVVSAYFAFGTNALWAYIAKQTTCKDIWNSPAVNSTIQYKTMYANATSSQESAKALLAWQTACLRSKSFQPSVWTTIGFTIVSSMVQMLYDQYGQMVVTCSCVQRSPVYIKCIAEGIGKMAFGVMLLVAGLSVFLAVFIIRELGGDFQVSVITFFITRVGNFLVITSMIVLITFTMARRSQMKPPPEVLATEEGRKKWEEAPESCLATCSACVLTCTNPVPASDLWNKHIGADKSFADLPARPPDWDWDFKVSYCCCSLTHYRYAALNPMPWPDKLEGGDPEGSLPAAGSYSNAAAHLPAQVQMEMQTAGAHNEQQALYMQQALYLPQPLPQQPYACPPQQQYAYAAHQQYAYAAPQQYAMPQEQYAYNPEYQPPPHQQHPYAYPAQQNLQTQPEAQAYEYGYGQMPGGWEEKWDATQGRPYFVNHGTQTTQWDRPV